MSKANWEKGPNSSLSCPQQNSYRLHVCDELLWYLCVVKLPVDTIPVNSSPATAGDGRGENLFKTIVRSLK
jgi:hypothetical protein